MSPTKRRWVGGLLVGAGALTTVALAYLGNQTRPISASQNAVLVFVALVAQLAAAWVFSGQGRPDPGLATAATRRLWKLATRVAEARQLAEALQRDRGREDRGEGIGLLSVHLSYIEEGCVEALEDWKTFLPDEVQRAKQEEAING